MVWDMESGKIVLRIGDETVEAEKNATAIKDTLRRYGIARAVIYYDDKPIEPADLANVPDGAILTVVKESVGA